MEEAAVAALSTLSAVKTKEGGGEFRIYSGPGSVTAFLSSSDFHQDDSEPYINTRVRPADLQLYSQGFSSVIDMTNAPPRISKLTDAILEQKLKLPPPALCHYLFNYFHEVHLFADRHNNFPRGCYQHSYDALFTPEHRDVSEAAESARALRFPQLASEHSLAFISLVFVMLALALSLSPDTSPESHQLASALYENSRQGEWAGRCESSRTSDFTKLMPLPTQPSWRPKDESNQPMPSSLRSSATQCGSRSQGVPLWVSPTLPRRRVLRRHKVRRSAYQPAHPSVC